MIEITRTALVITTATSRGQSSRCCRQRHGAGGARATDFAQVRDVELLDMDLGETVPFDADPDRWARILLQALRSGVLVCGATGDPAPHTALAK